MTLAEDETPDEPDAVERTRQAGEQITEPPRMADIGSLLGGLGVGGNIGKAIVQLELETTKYQAELRSAQAQTVAVNERI